MKTNTKIAIAAFVLFVAGVVYVNNLMSEHPYMHIDCPECSMHRVLDCGYDEDGDAHGHCLDCGADLTLYGYAPD